MSVAKHPAKFSPPLLPKMIELLGGYPRVIDPMAGVGTLSTCLEWLPFTVISNELEWPWLEQCLEPRTQADARHLPFQADSFDAIVTSPTYGNRMADHHEARDSSKRNTYRHTLGRQLSSGNTGALQWGIEYRSVHRDIIAECVRVLRPGGRVLWNVKDHIRARYEDRG